jgi:hypothetical protein
MSVIADKMRKRAGDLDAALQQTLNTKPTIDADLVRATKAAVVPELLMTLADMLDVLENQETLDGTLGRLQKIAKRNNAVRLAAAKGDWDAIDRIASGDIDSYIADAGTGTTGSGGS